MAAIENVFEKLTNELNFRALSISAQWQSQLCDQDLSGPFLRAILPTIAKVSARFRFSGG